MSSLLCSLRLFGPHFRRSLGSCRRTDIWHRCKCRGRQMSSFSWLKPRIYYCHNYDVIQVRSIHKSSRIEMASTSSSKIEETVKRLREKHSERMTEIQKITNLDERVKSVIKLDQETTSAIEKARTEDKALKKKSLWVRFVDEVKHYKSGFQLLLVDIRVSSKILWKISRGGTLTRREQRQLVRTVGDLFRLVPFLAFVIIPFMEFLLPVALKLFPGMLPSTFATESEKMAKTRRELVAKLEYAKFLQKTLDEMNPTDRKAEGRSSQSARDFVNFYKEIREGNQTIDNEQILKFSKLFEDDITLDNMTRSQLSAICRLLELQPIGSKNILSFSIEMKLRALKADDRVIRREGIDQMSVAELQMACKERGMRSIGLQKEQLVKQMEEWLDLSLNAQVPPSLLLLSRTLYLPTNLDPAAQLAQTISALPDSAAKRTSAEIGMKEGKTRNVAKLEVIQEEQRKIEEEAKLAEAEFKKSEVEMEKLFTPAGLADKVVQEAVETIAKATVTESGEITNKKEEEFVEVLKEQKVVPIEQRELSVEDFSDLKTAIEKLGKVKTETDEIMELEKELKDYEEDVQDLKTIKKEVSRHGLDETKGAQVLHRKVNKVLDRVGGLVKRLSSQKKTIEDQEVKSSEEEKHIVTINELIEAVQHLEKEAASPSAKTEQIAQVLALMDEDKDGVVQVDHVMKVIELLGTSHAKLPAKQIRQIVEMLAKEEMVQMEEDIEDALKVDSADDTDIADDIKRVKAQSEEFEEETKRLEDAATSLSEDNDGKNVKKNGEDK